MASEAPTVDLSSIVAASIALPCTKSVFDETLKFFTDRLGFVVNSISPADAPSSATIAAYGLTLTIDSNVALTVPAPSIRLRFNGDAATSMLAPNGSVVYLIPDDAPLVIPDVSPTYSLVQLNEQAGSSASDAGWGTGRAGMLYRDLIPDRTGGRFVASHIRIVDGGPVPDYVHFHKIRFQMIYCRKGWVKVVYEDQGEPFVLKAGDCVLQPPRIRHRALESSAGLEVVEIGCPAVHDTIADHTMHLPTDTVDPSKDFGGQLFVRHVAEKADWVSFRWKDWECRDTGINDATNGLSSVRVARPVAGTSGAVSGTEGMIYHQAELVFMFVLKGSLIWHCEAESLSGLNGPGKQLAGGAAMVVPNGVKYSISECLDDVEILEIALPAAFETHR